MIVVNKKPNITHLPYVHGKQKGVLSLNPGQNTVDPQIFKAACEQIGEKRWNAHYRSFLKPISGDDSSGALVDPTKLSADDAVDLVKGAMDMALLDDYARAENARKGGARKTVLTAIEQQSAEIKAIETAKGQGN